MALHRDIFWIGRQWAVTGHGIQAVDQRLKGAFDVDRSALWDDGPRDLLRQQAWFNEADFEKALSVARARFAAEPRAEISSAPAGPQASSASVAPALSLRLGTRGRLGRFLPQWRIRH